MNQILHNNFLVLSSFSFLGKESDAAVSKVDIFNLMDKILKPLNSQEIAAIGVSTIADIVRKLNDNELIEICPCPQLGSAEFHKNTRKGRMGGNRKCYKITERGDITITQTLKLKQRLLSVNARNTSDCISLGRRFCIGRQAVLLALLNGPKTQANIKKFIEEVSYGEFKEINYFCSLNKLVWQQLVKRRGECYEITEYALKVFDWTEQVILLLIPDMYDRLDIMPPLFMPGHK
ncbi:MAG: hypothetical protein GPJ14_13165 [Microcystis aeruginosa G11-01]|nr:hypothetical protein [Microcystis aeruginosa G11-01]